MNKYIPQISTVFRLIYGCAIIFLCSCQPQQEYLPSIDSETIAREVVWLTEKNGGATYHLSRGNLLGQPFYAVAINPEDSLVIEGTLTASDVLEFMDDRKAFLQQDNHSIGTWTDQSNRRIFLELTVITPDLEEALALGRIHGQKSIYDLERQMEIPVNKDELRQIPGEMN